MHPLFLIPFLLRPAARPVAAPAGFSSQALARHWAQVERARHGQLTAVVAVEAPDEALAQLQLALRLQAKFREEWHATDKAAHQELRRFMSQTEGQPWQIGR